MMINTLYLVPLVPLVETFSCVLDQIFLVPQLPVEEPANHSWTLNASNGAFIVKKEEETLCLVAVPVVSILLV